MHITPTSQFSTFAKNRLRSSTGVGLIAFAGLALAATASLLTGGVAPAESTGGLTQLTVSLPIDTFANSVPNNTVIIKPVGVTAMDASLNYIGFQGDFTFNETVVAFAAPFVQKAGVTGGNWNVSGNVLPGPGPIRTLRISAFANDSIPLSGSGTLFELRMLRVSNTPGTSTPLTWQPAPNNFFFIDADLNTAAPAQDDGRINISGLGPSATARPHPIDTVPPEDPDPTRQRQP